MGGLGRRKEESERRKEESERTKQALHECLMARSICSNTPIGIPLTRTQSQELTWVEERLRNISIFKEK